MALHYSSETYEDHSLKVKIDDGCGARVLAYRASVPSGPHAMLPAESILFLFDRFEHKWRRVHGLLDGG